MKKRSFALLNLFLIFVFLLTSGFGCKNPGKAVQEKLQPVTLEYWRLWDDADAFDEIISDYRTLHPNIQINYRKFRYEEYEKALLEAWAEDRGPDLFSINESWLRKYQSRIEPMPDEITMAYQVVKGSLKKEITSQLRTKKTPSLRQLKADFVDTVYHDVLIDGRVYGLPLSLETLVMFYNRSILNKAGIAQPPASWKDFQKSVEKSTKFDSQGNIIQSGTAMGTGNNINSSVDLLSVLMMQDGATMTDANGSPTFFNQTAKDRNPGQEALKFYLDFSNPTKNVYSWNSDQLNYLDAFLTGKVGMIFSYNYQLPVIRSRAPKLNFGVAPTPQVNSGDSKNFANYFVETVSKKSKHTNEAWDFILFASREKEGSEADSRYRVEKFLNKTNRPTALRDLVNSQLENEDLYATASQVLTASNWYRGQDAIAADTAIKEMIDLLNKATTEREIDTIIRNALQKINQTNR
jgi:multiple sugar transport system substrate-binding protein